MKKEGGERERDWPEDPTLGKAALEGEGAVGKPAQADLEQASGRRRGFRKRERECPRLPLDLAMRVTLVRDISV